MILGIVGSEEIKFTEQGKLNACSKIMHLVNDPLVTEVCSGECHLGGIDIWTKEITLNVGKIFTPFPPYGLYWTEFKKRNELIAYHSDHVWCITVDVLPKEYTGMRFEECYHCAKHSILNPPPHIKSGGCWTMYKAIECGKKGSLFVVHNY